MNICRTVGGVVGNDARCYLATGGAEKEGVDNRQECATPNLACVQDVKKEQITFFLEKTRDEGDTQDYLYTKKSAPYMAPPRSAWTTGTTCT